MHFKVIVPTSSFKYNEEMSTLEDSLVWLIQDFKLPTPVREFKFLSDRRFRFDLAWPDLKLACEIEGAVWVQGRHTRGAGFEKDCEKYNLAVINGWRVLRVTSNHINNGAAIRWVKSALGFPDARQQVLKVSTATSGYGE